MRSTRVISALILALGMMTPGCQARSTTGPPCRSTARSRRAPAPTVPRDDPRFHCTADADCMATCALGAVTHSWWKEFGAPYAACQDGCASKGTFARCVDQACVTFRRVDGRARRVEHCNFRSLPIPRPTPPARKAPPRERP